MALEPKKYLDFVGLASYDEKIKEYIKTNGSDVTDKLVALIGAAEKGEDEKTILARVADLETAVGDVSELGEEVENLVKAILGESARATAAEEGIAKDLAALDELLHGGSEGVGELAELEAKITGVIEDLDSSENTSVKVAGVTVTVDQVDGLVSKPVVTVDDNAVEFTTNSEGKHFLTVADEAAVVKGDAIAPIKGYVDAVIADLGEGAAEELATLTDRLYGSEGDIPSIESRLDVIEGEGEGSIKKAAADTVAQIVAEAPEAFDTLKEIAEWIAKSAENSEGFDAAKRIEALEESLANSDSELRALIEAEEDRATGVEADLLDMITSEGARAEAAEADLLEMIEAFTPITEAELVSLFASEGM